MTRFIGVLALSTCAFAAACITGITPPEPTTLVPIAGGAFLFGTTEVCPGDATPGATTCTTVEQSADKNLAGLPPTWPTVLVTLKPFAIEEHEVTNLQYRYCVSVGDCPEPDFTNAGNFSDYYGNPNYDNYPVVAVTPKAAATYCRFLGRRLPSEAEWERAAAGAATTESAKRRVAILDGQGALEACDQKNPKVELFTCNGQNQPAEVMTSTDDYVTEGGRKIWDLTGNVSEIVGAYFVQNPDPAKPDQVSGFYKADLTCKESLPASCDCFACTNDTCRGDCYSQCDACTNAGAACFTMCDKTVFQPGGIPRCIAYPADAQDPAILQVETGTARAVRGGSYVTKAAQFCKARAADRTQNWDLNKGRTEIGFRCVADQ